MNRPYYIAFIGTNSVRGSLGIYSVRIDADTKEAALVATHQVYNTGALSIGTKHHRLYAASEGMTFKGVADGGVYGYSFDAKGQLTELGAARSHGQRTCAVALDDAEQNAYGANFYEGTWVKWPLDENGAPKEASLVVEPPDVPGAFLKALHCVKAIGEDYVAVISLTEGALVVYRSDDGSRVTEFTFPGKPFCRYLEVCGNYIYALMQDPGDVYVFRNRLDENGTIEHIQTISVQREKMERYGTTTIRVTPNHQLMIAATREANSLTVFRIMEDGRLELSDVVTLNGEVPRDFAISGDGALVVSCLQKTNEICVHEIDYDKATLVDCGIKLAIPSPAAAAMTGRM
jgi:6-phosphogluconolactonase